MSWAAPGVFVVVVIVGTVGALIAFRSDRPWAYVISKAVASSGFVGAALAVGALDTDWTSLALVALILSAAGDVVLGIHGKWSLLGGLACFAAAHLAYTAAFLFRGSTGTVLVTLFLPAAALVSVGWLVFGRRVPRSMRTPVLIYATVLSAMVATGLATAITHQALTLAAGVLLVAGSDVAVARERFGAPTPVTKLIGLPAYYAGQTLIALSLASVLAGT